MARKILAIAAVAALLAFALPIQAQEEEEVSDAVDIALWCGAAYTVAASVPDVSAEDAAAANAMAELAFGRAQAAMDADEIDPAEYDRLVEFYVSEAVTDMSTDVEMRYSDEECEAEVLAE